MKYLQLFVFLLLTYSLFAQCTIKGVMVDEANEGLPGVSIVVLEPSDSSLIKGTITDVNGRFVVQDLVYNADFTTTQISKVLDGPYKKGVIEKIETDKKSKFQYRRIS